MIPGLGLQEALTEPVLAFITQLKSRPDFKGEIDEALSSRLLVSTDNSIYQVLPEAVIFPRTEGDLIAIFKLASQAEHRSITFSPRGGGTGTNGQALSAGIIIDCSRHMNQILELNLKEGWVRVQPGVVLDQLNDFLRPQGKFFAPTLSPSSRATLGGMVSTDASGKGSRLYGKTSQHVLSLTAVYPDGELHTSEAISLDRLPEMKALPGRVGQLYRQVEKTVSEHQDVIKQQFPRLARFMTGYNLDRIYSADGQGFNINAVLTGSEGSLAYFTEMKLKLTDIPKCRCLYVVLYRSFSEALEHARELVEFKPEAIETMDGTLLNLAKTDIIYQSVRDFVTSESQSQVEAINLVEFVAQDEASLRGQSEPFRASLASFAFHYLETESDIAQLWELRKRSVGLLGKVKGVRKPTSGVEDTVVPPEHLAAYVEEFRAILDKHGLIYGMFGHIDVGCLHVRPAYNLMDERDREIYYQISDEVAELTRKYGGLLWGEHGKGFRSEYVPLFFGEILYAELRKIKASCDPYNQLNPGKIAVPEGVEAELAKVRSEQLRAKADRQIDSAFHQPYQLALSCNGNGACFDYSQSQVICPSYKITHDRIHSPKGRAGLVREWLRQLSLAKPQRESNWPLKKWLNRWRKRQGQYDFSHAVYEAMDGCLGCQACKSQCPVNIDVPSFKSRFLEAYHSRYPRRLKDYLIAYSERLGYYQSLVPGVSNLVLSNSLVKAILSRLGGLIDLPSYSRPRLASQLRQAGIASLDLENLPSPEGSVVLIQDWVTSYYEADLVVRLCQFIEKLGYKVYVCPWLENGKALAGQGMRKAYQRVVAKTVQTLERLAAQGLPMIGLDPAMVLSYRFEYPEIMAKPANYQVHLVQEWLVEILPGLDKSSVPVVQSEKAVSYTLLSHCTEQANCASAGKQWQTVFAFFGLDLRPQKVGCCGMAGAYGHELSHMAESKGLFDLSWKAFFSDPQQASYVVVDGFSCRSQVKRFGGKKALHPFEVLLALLD